MSLMLIGSAPAPRANVVMGETFGGVLSKNFDKLRSNDDIIFTPSGTGWADSAEPKNRADMIALAEAQVRAICSARAKM